MFNWFGKNRDKKCTSSVTLCHEDRILEFIEKSNKLVRAVRTIDSVGGSSLGCGISIRGETSSRYSLGAVKTYNVKLRGKTVFTAYSGGSSLGDFVSWSVSNPGLKKEIVNRILLRYDEILKNREIREAEKQKAKDLEEQNMLNNLRGCSSN